MAGVAARVASDQCNMWLGSLQKARAFVALKENGGARLNCQASGKCPNMEDLHRNGKAIMRRTRE